MTHVKNHESAEKEARLQDAIAEYRKRQTESRNASLNRVAKDFNVPRSTQPTSKKRGERQGKRSRLGEKGVKAVQIGWQLSQRMGRKLVRQDRSRL